MEGFLIMFQRYMEVPFRVGAKLFEGSKHLNLLSGISFKPLEPREGEPRQPEMA